MDFFTWFWKRWWLCLIIFFTVGALTQLYLTGTIFQRYSIGISFGLCYGIYKLETQNMEDLD